MSQPNVAKIKQTVRERDGFRCTGCGLTADESKAKYGRTLDVHRLTPGSLYSLDGCVTICKDCHYTQPKRPRGTPDLASAIRKVALPDRLLDAVEPLADYYCTDISEIVRRACIEYLELAGKWPPKPPAGG